MVGQLLGFVDYCLGQPVNGLANCSLGRSVVHWWVGWWVDWLVVQYVCQSFMQSCISLGWAVVGLVCWVVGGLVAGLVEGFQPRRDHKGTDLVHLPLRRNPVTILQEGGWAPGGVWTGLENLLPAPWFHPQTSQVIANLYTHVTKPRESRYTSTLPSALEGHQWLTCSHQINSGKEPLYPFINSRVGHRAIQDFRRTEKFLSLPGFKPWTSRTDAILTKLYGSWNFNLQQALVALPPGRKHCTHCTGGLGGHKIYCPHWDSIPRPCNPWRFTIPTSQGRIGKAEA